MTLNSYSFGTCSNGQVATLYRLSRADGLEIHLSDYGATLVALTVPDRSGVRCNVVLGYDSVEEYQRQTHYFGGLVGRFANRIAGGKFALNGKAYDLTVNNGANHLHGGSHGFDRRLWRATALSGDSVTLEYTSVDGEEGYPGTLSATATFTLPAPYTLRLDLTARCDQTSIVNLTSHSYFNLAGQGDILRHDLTVPAAAFTPVDAGLIPTGDLQPVGGTPFDFRIPTAIGARIHTQHPQLIHGSGYDHNFVLKTTNSPELTLAARLADPESGRTLEIHSTQPGLQVYSGNYLDNDVAHNGRSIPRYGAVALEPHNFPDAPNHPHFPSAVITPELPYRQTIEYRFDVLTQ